MIEAPCSGSNSRTSSSMTKQVEAVASSSWGIMGDQHYRSAALCMVCDPFPQWLRASGGSSRCSGSSRISSDDGRISPAASSNLRRWPEDKASGGMAWALPEARRIPVLPQRALRGHPRSARGR